MILCVQAEQCAVKMDARPYLVSPFNMKDPPQEEACRANSFMYWFNFSILIILQPSIVVCSGSCISVGSGVASVVLVFPVTLSFLF